MSNGLSGKVAIVTGAQHGIGAATAEALAAEGAAVFVTYLRLPLDPALACQAAAGAIDTPGQALYAARQASTADAVLQAIREQGGQAAACEANLANPGVIPELFDRAEAAFGPVSILVNNAAFCVPDTLIPDEARGANHTAAGGYALETLTAETHDWHFAINSRAVALMMAEFARRHIRRGADWGRIINISTDGASAFASEISYGASKHAMESYSRAAALELGPFGITVNIVSPGPTQTGWISPENEREWGRRAPLGRVGQPEDIADVVLLLASDQARWLTGQLLYAGGGHKMPL